MRSRENVGRNGEEFGERENRHSVVFKHLGLLQADGAGRFTGDSRVGS